MAMSVAEMTTTVRPIEGAASSNKIIIIGLCALGLLAIGFLIFRSFSGMRSTSTKDPEVPTPSLVKDLQKGQSSRIFDKNQIDTEITKKDSDGLNVMHHAVVLQKGDVVDHLLLIGCPVDTIMRNKAKEKGYTEWVEVFSDEQKLSNYLLWKVIDKEYELSSERKEAFQKALDRTPPPDVNVQKQGQTPLQTLVLKGQRECVEKLVGCSVDLEILDKRGYNLLHLLFEPLKQKPKELMLRSVIFSSILKMGSVEKLIGQKTTDGMLESPLEFFLRITDKNTQSDPIAHIIVDILLDGGSAITENVNKYAKSQDINEILKKPPVTRKFDRAIQDADLSTIKRLVQPIQIFEKSDHLARLLEVFSEKRLNQTEQKRLAEVMKAMLNKGISPNKCAEACYLDFPINYAVMIGVEPVKILLSDENIILETGIYDPIKGLFKESALSDDEKIQILDLFFAKNVIVNESIIFRYASLDIVQHFLKKVQELGDLYDLGQRLKSLSVEERAAWQIVLKQCMDMKPDSAGKYFYEYGTSETIEERLTSGVDEYSNVHFKMWFDKESDKTKWFELIRRLKTEHPSLNVYRLVYNFGPVDFVCDCLRDEIVQKTNHWEDSLLLPRIIDNKGKSDQILRAMFPFATTEENNCISNWVRCYGSDQLKLELFGARSN